MNSSVNLTLVSTIIPVHNRPDMIVEAVNSVLAQTYRPIEVIIVDDGSTDTTAEVIRQLVAEHPEIRSAGQENSGPGVARELGRQMALGGFIQYLDSDDLLLKDKFALQVNALLENPEAGIAYGKTHHCRVGDALQPVALKRTGEVIEYLFPALLVSRWWATSSPLFRRSVTESIGPWSDLWNEEDREYEARAGMLNTPLVYCDDFVSVQRWHDSDRLCVGGTIEPIKLQHRSKAQALIFQHAEQGGYAINSSEWNHFVCALFLLARQCGAAGLAAESKKLCQLAKQGSICLDQPVPKLKAYRVAATLFGWVNVARFSVWFDRTRQGKREGGQ